MNKVKHRKGGSYFQLFTKLLVVSLFSIISDIATSSDRAAYSPVLLTSPSGYLSSSVGS